MVNYSELRKKFQAKNPEIEASRKKSREAAKRIAREYEQKRAELGLNQPKITRTPVYYVIVVLVMVMLASAFIMMMTGRIGLGKKQISKADLQVHRSINALAQALGRYKFHVGEYPTTAEGLEALAAIIPNKKGWFGPYIKKVVPDPWGHAYVYEKREEGGSPVLYSMGPDGRAGTTDDILPEVSMFEEPFRDTTWTNHWVPYQLRGILVAPDKATKKKWQDEVKRY